MSDWVLDSAHLNVNVGGFQVLSIFSDLNGKRGQKRQHGTRQTQNTLKTGKRMKRELHKTTRTQDTS